MKALLISKESWAVGSSDGQRRPTFLIENTKTKEKRSVVAMTILHIPNHCSMDKWVAARCVYLGLATVAEWQQSVYSGSYVGLYGAEHLERMHEDDQYRLDQGCLRHNSTGLRMRQQYTSPGSGRCSSDPGYGGTRTTTEQVRGRCSLIYQVILYNLVYIVGLDNM